MMVYEESVGSHLGGQIGRCRSPIEQRFLSALFFMTDNAWMPAWDAPTIAVHMPSKIRLQVQVPVEQYKIDFVMVTRYERKFAIEIDGYTYHGATPEQFTHDSARQRFITERGYTFLRFSGQEIAKRPVACVMETMKCVKNASTEASQYVRDQYKKIDDLPYEDQMTLMRRLSNRARSRADLELQSGEEMSDERMVELGLDLAVFNTTGKFRPFSDW
jgi:very-short-patch-repair endonuclease